MVAATDEDTYPPASILIVDDNAANLTALTAVLDSLGQRVVKASSGEEALRRVMDEEFAVILIDVQMPGMDGFQTVSLLSQHPRARNTPTVFLSAYHQDVVAARKGYAAGAIDYMDFVLGDGSPQNQQRWRDGRNRMVVTRTQNPAGLAPSPTISGGAFSTPPGGPDRDTGRRPRSSRSGSSTS